jgi:cbb3-type cytochrome oxidase subunit 3|tara:strand:+ start:328 stop:621 length:294 start_codon:yes stop_codon:yes gene_type:complete
MSKRILQFIVFLLAFLIFICFLALVYGLYIKIAKKQSNLEINNINYNLNLKEGHEITDIDLIDDNRILFTIKNNDKIYALIYDIRKSNIIKIDKAND